jgi:hypothetical protein
MKTRKEIKPCWMLLLIITITIAGTNNLVVASDSNIESDANISALITDLSSASLDIKANGQDGPITVSSNSPISITIGIDAGNQIGTFADWWLVVSTPNGLYS